MTMVLTDAQRALLRSEPLEQGHTTKIRRAARLANTNITAVAAALGLPYQQLNRYVTGGDPLLSTAWRIAALFGLTPCDLWPNAPRSRRREKRAAAAAKLAPKPSANGRRRAPKAEAA